MKSDVPRFRILLASLAFLLFAPSAFSLELESGEPIEGTPVEFDFGEKLLTVENRATGDRTIIPTNRLSLRSRQQLLFSPLLHRSYPKETMWPKEKVRLLTYGILAPMAALFIGFWIAGIFIAGKFNPILAFFGFAGSWVVGTMYVVFYLFFAIRLQQAAAFTFGGILMISIFVPMMVSAVYNCSFLKGMGIFLFQLVAACCVLAIALVAIELTVDPDALENWWQEHVFVPVGLCRE